MRILPFSLLALWACTPTTAPEAPLPDAVNAPPQAQEDDEVADEDIVSVRAPGALAETIRAELADDPDAEPEPAPEAAEAPGAEPTPPAQPALPVPGAKASPPCDGLDAALGRAFAGDTAGLALDAEGRVQVTYEFSSVPQSLPDGFVHETSAMGHGQGWCPPALLCELAATPGIDRVRTVRRASPKLD
jgi:hypothetical protein